MAPADLQFRRGGGLWRPYDFIYGLVFCLTFFYLHQSSGRLVVLEWVQALFGGPM